MAEKIKVIRESPPVKEEDLLTVPFRGRLSQPAGISVRSGDGPIKITETVERLCCAPQDLKPVFGCPLIGGKHPKLKFCKHCGKQWHYESYMDAAGSMDWDYFAEDEPV